MTKPTSGDQLTLRDFALAFDCHDVLTATNWGVLTKPDVIIVYDSRGDQNPDVDTEAAESLVTYFSEAQAPDLYDIAREALSEAGSPIDSLQAIALGQSRADDPNRLNGEPCRTMYIV